MPIPNGSGLTTTNSDGSSTTKWPDGTSIT
jgi:hypothetical protein